MTTISAHCVGGPLNGWQVTPRYPKGFLLVNRVAGEVVIYDRVTGERGDDVTWQARPDETGEVKRPESRESRWRAAEEPNYDVMAYDPAVMPPW